jgi:hypothetical protein
MAGEIAILVELRGGKGESNDVTRKRYRRDEVLTLWDVEWVGAYAADREHFLN